LEISTPDPSCAQGLPTEAGRFQTSPFRAGGCLQRREVSNRHYSELCRGSAGSHSRRSLPSRPFALHQFHKQPRLSTFSTVSSRAPRGTCESTRILFTISWRPLRASTMGRGAQFQKQPRFSLCRRTLANPRRHQKGLAVGVPDRFRGDLCPDDPLHCASFTRNRGCSLSRRSRRGRPEAFARVREFYSRSRGGPFGPPQWAGVRVSRRHFLCVRAPSTEAGDF